MFYLSKLSKTDGDLLFYETSKSASTRAELQGECDSLNNQYEALIGAGERPYEVFEINTSLWFRVKSYFMYLGLKIRGKL